MAKHTSKVVSIRISSGIADLITEIAGATGTSESKLLTEVIQKAFIFSVDGQINMNYANFNGFQEFIHRSIVKEISSATESLSELHITLNGVAGMSELITEHSDAAQLYKADIEVLLNSISERIKQFQAISKSLRKYFLIAKG
jgi:hypothetical protein